MRFLVTSLVASLALTIVLNAVPRLFPGLGRRVDDALESTMRRPSDEDRRVRVIVPWKAMVVASVLLTVVLNLVVRLG